MSKPLTMSWKDVDLSNTPMVINTPMRNENFSQMRNTD